MVRRRAEPALFIVGRPGDRFEAIEAPAAVTGLPVVRAEREIDPQLLRSRELGFLNGHVPVTGIISAIAVMAAVLEGRDAVVMSNEWSASIPTLEAGGRAINHQWSKSDAFEAGFRAVLAGPSGPGVAYFSALRPFSELWVAERFAGLTAYHATFRSCNRAFHIDRSLRLDHWCGRCDKCCFIDLILAPFLPAAELGAIFAGREPLADPAPTRPGRPVPGAARHVGGQQAVRVRGRGQRVPGGGAAGRAAAGPGGHQAAPGAGGRTGRPARPARQRTCSARWPSTSSRMTMRPTISWSELARRPRRACGASASRAWPTCASWRRSGVDPVLVDDRPPRGRRWPARSWPPPAAGWTRWPRCEVVVKSPGISRYRPEVAAAGRPRHPGGGRPGPVAGGGATATGWCASPGPRARAAPRLSPGTC